MGSVGQGLDRSDSSSSALTLESLTDDDEQGTVFHQLLCTFVAPDLHVRYYHNTTLSLLISSLCPSGRGEAASSGRSSAYSPPGCP